MQIRALVSAVDAASKRERLLMFILNGGGSAQTASRNLLLGQLADADRARLRPHMEQVVLPRGTRLHAPSLPIDWIYFPEAGLLALEGRVGKRGPVEIAVIGREGLLGWPALLGGLPSQHSAVARAQDHRATRVGAEPLLAACRASATLLSLLLGFVQEVVGQMARTIVSHSENSLEQRLARWLLMRHDRVGGDQILASHDEIADALNVRRASVTDHLQLLEGDELLRCRRGRITVRNRPGLERSAGSAYGMAEAGSCAGLR